MLDSNQREAIVGAWRALAAARDAITSVMASGSTSRRDVLKRRAYAWGGASLFTLQPWLETPLYLLAPSSAPRPSAEAHESLRPAIRRACVSDAEGSFDDAIAIAEANVVRMDAR